MPSVPRLPSTPKPVDISAIAFRRRVFPQRLEMRHRFALFCHLEPQLPARICLTVERLGNSRRAAPLAENQNLRLKVTAVVLHLQHGRQLAPRAAFARCPLASIQPSSHARAASVRVLKDRTAHSHLSILTPVIVPLVPFSYRRGISVVGHPCRCFLPNCKIRVRAKPARGMLAGHGGNAGRWPTCRE
jgi:hypothetical protein